jgi:lipoprotein-anchoring transpeptidase ErfK/SrfK
MARGRHVKRRRARAVAIVAAIAAVLLLLAGGAAFAAFRYEQARADRILPGVRVAGVDLSGMTREQATAALEAAARTQLDARLVVRVGEERWTVTRAELGQRADVRRAVNRAFAVSDSMGTFDRFWHRFRKEPVRKWIPLRIQGDSKIKGFVRTVADEVEIAPVDADITLREGELTFVKAKPGRALDTAGARRAIRVALASEAPRVALDLTKVTPDVRPEDLGRNVVVRVDQNRLYLYDGFRVVRTWAVATAKPGYTTPVGVWNVYNKAEYPTWYNPALDSWGADLPAVIPGGPGNPMGTRAIYIDAPGLIRIHGTTSDDSIGRWASHGCIRMHNWEVEELYPMVDIGSSKVIIVGERPPGAQEWDTPAASDI